jgi:hypothetical protein
MSLVPDLQSRASRSKPRFEAHSLRRPPDPRSGRNIRTETSRASCDRPDPSPRPAGSQELWRPRSLANVDLTLAKARLTRRSICKL